MIFIQNNLLGVGAIDKCEREIDIWCFSFVCLVSNTFHAQVSV